MATLHFAMTEKKWMVLDFGMEDIGNNISLVEGIISQVGFQIDDLKSHSYWLALLISSYGTSRTSDYWGRKLASTNLKTFLSHLCCRFEEI